MHDLNLPQRKYYLFRSFVSELLDPDPSSRLNFETILNHPFFDSVYQQSKDTGQSMSSKHCSPQQREQSCYPMFMDKTTPNMSLNENSLVKMRLKSRLSNQAFSPDTPLSKCQTSEKASNRQHRCNSNPSSVQKLG